MALSLTELELRMEDLKRESNRLSDMLKGVRGAPLVQGYAGKKLDLNENLNVVLLNDRVSDASRLTKGTLSTDLFSAIDDLGAEDAIGTGSEQVSAGDHTHSTLHTRQHAITSTSDHTSTETPGAILKADASGLPVTASAADVEGSHTHSKIVASDGSPDPALSADASGNLTAVADLKSATGRVGSASHYTNIDSTGHQTMVGDARPWRDQLTDSLNLQQNGTGVSINKTESTVEFAHNSTYNATFTLADALFTNVQLNHDKDLTVSIYPHIHWIQEKNYVPNFLLEYRWQINGGAKTTAWTKLKCIASAFTYVSGSLNQISYSAAIAVPVGTNLSDIVQFRIFRDTGNASSEFTGTCPYNTGGNAAVGILAFDVHFQINSIGSTDELTK